MMDEQAKATQDDQAAFGGGPGSAAREAGTDPAADRSSYLEQDRNNVTRNKERKTKREKEVGEICYEVRSCGCKSWFCPTCCLGKGIALKQKLKSRLEQFQGLMMLTFTLDPQLFKTPEEAYQYVKDHRCIATTLQTLDRLKHLHSRNYVSVIEWQKDSEMPHWHVLIDASIIPFGDLCLAWNRNWKNWEQRVEQGRPGFGSVNFRKTRLDREDAAGYVTAYLTKYPDHGFPAWVTSRKVGSIRRYEASRGFWNDGEPDDEDEASSESAEEDCIKSETVPSQEPSTVKPRPTIEEQVERCGEESIVLLAKTTVDEKTGEVVTKREFIRRLPMSLPAVLEGLPVPTGINNANTCAEFPYIPAITAALSKVREISEDSSANKWYNPSQ